MKHTTKLILPILLFVLLSLALTTATPATAANPPALARALAYLESVQRPTGGWGTGDTAVRDTAAAIQALAFLRPSSAKLPPAYAWLLNRPARSTAERARVALLVGGRPGGDALTAALRASQNPVERNKDRPNAPEGGWGVAAGYTSDSQDTALALAALKAASVPDSALLPAVAYLVAAQNSDGGWGIARGASSALGVTSRVLVALGAFPSAPGVAAAIGKARQYLLARQHSDGGWGIGASTVVESALAYRALRAGGMSATVKSKGESYLLSRQGANGSWNNQPYDTALAILALGSTEVYVPVVRR